VLGFRPNGPSLAQTGARPRVTQLAQQRLSWPAPHARAAQLQKSPWPLHESIRHPSYYSPLALLFALNFLGLTQFKHACPRRFYARRRGTRRHTMAKPGHWGPRWLY
jgi:hypothetical protein